MLSKVDSAAQVKILNKAVCILQSTNTPEKCMEPTILSSAMSK